jgi:hypothetical protein
MLKCLMPDPIPALPRPGVSEMLETAAQLFKHALLKCLPAMMVGALFAEAAEIYWLATGHAATPSLQTRDPAYYAIAIAGGCLYMLVAGAILLQLRALQGGAQRPWSDLFAASFARWPTLLLAWALASVGIALGLLALIIPGIYLLVCLTPLLPVLMFEPLSAFDSLKRAIALTRTMWVKVLASLVIAMLVVFVCMIVAGAILALIRVLSGQESGPGGSALSTTFSLLVAAVAQVFFYSLTLVIYTSASASA